MKERAHCWLSVPHPARCDIETPSCDSAVALDPGIRTFLTFFSETECRKIGHRARAVTRDEIGFGMDRDVNGARGIFLRALGDSPFLRELLAQVASRPTEPCSTLVSV